MRLIVTNRIRDWKFSFLIEGIDAIYTAKIITELPSLKPIYMEILSWKREYTKR